MKPSPLALPLKFVSCVLSGNRAGGRWWMFVGRTLYDLFQPAQECAGYQTAVGEEGGGSWD